jgi:hypothetical protein
MMLFPLMRLIERMDWCFRPGRCLVHGWDISLLWSISCQMMLVTSSSLYRPVISSAVSATLVGRDRSERRSLPFRGQKR